MADPNWFNKTLEEVDPEGVTLSTYLGPNGTHNEKFHSLQSEQFMKYQAYCYYNPKSDICAKMEKRISEEHQVSHKDASAVRVLASLPYAFCNNQVNKLRQEHVTEECKKDQSNSGPFFTIFGGLLLLGVGRTVPFALGLPLMDDNVKKHNLPLYFACMFFVKILGPVIGLLIGSKLNEIYYNFNPPQGLTPLDPMWIGCWWLGFIIFGVFLFFPSLALFLFPSDRLDESNVKIYPKETAVEGTAPLKPRKTLNLYDKHVTIHGKHVTASEKMKEFGTTARSLFRNPIYVGAIFARIVDVLAFKGFFVFLGKYLEIQYGVPQYKVQKYLAVTGIVGFGFGVLCGSVAMRKFRLQEARVMKIYQRRKAATWVAVCSLVAALMAFTNGAVGCNSVIGKIGEQAV
ncbi:organic Anion Transporter Polypeptide family protein [Cooperia oncophora]